MDSLRKSVSNHYQSPTAESVELLANNGEGDSIRPLHQDGILEYNEDPQNRIDMALKEGFSNSKRYIDNVLSHRAKGILIALLPSFVHPSTPRPPGSKPRKVYKTGWLDGLRGVASLMVMIHHSSWLWYPELSMGWGSDENSYHFVQLPIIRIFYMGSAMVAIFFVVSGFSLSHKALSLIRSQRYSELLDSLSSSAFRRGMRLVIPPAALTFFMMLFTYAGYYGTGGGSREPPHYDTFSQNFWHWFHTVLDISDIFRPLDYPGWYNPPYDTNLWTIDVEWGGSLAIFLTLLGVAKVRPAFRLLILAAIPLWLMYNVHTHNFLFMAGVLLCELHHMREDSAAESLESQKPKLRFLEGVLPQLYWPRVNKAFWIGNFIFAIYLLSMPLLGEGGASSPGYIWLAAHIPESFLHPYVEDHFWIFIAAVHLIWTIDNAPFLQKIFTTRFATYLGKISFALYLVHGTMLYTMGWHLSSYFLDRTGRDAGRQYATGVICTGCILYPVIFWLADLVYRFVDVKSVTFARWLHLKVSVSS